jgi:DNA-binding CsgD family transcriptional regulator
MNFLKNLLQKLGFKREKHNFHLDQSTLKTVQVLASLEQREEEEVAAELISFAVTRRRLTEDQLDYWHALTPREQDVTALICLGYTNPEIAELLGISPETVKTHQRHVYHKFRVRRKIELMQILSGWDFSSWRR